MSTLALTSTITASRTGLLARKSSCCTPTLWLKHITITSVLRCINALKAPIIILPIKNIWPARTDWTPERFLEWAASIHDDVRLYILKILDSKQHPEQSYRSCIGILSFAKKAGEQRLISACQRALSYGIYNCKTIHRAAGRTILEKNMDQYEDSLFADELQMPKHDNIRGEDYYQ